MIATTSLRAYQDLRDSGKEQTQKAKILSVIVKHPQGLTRRTIAAVTNIELGAVCGRVNSLSENGLVDEAEEIRCPVTGKMVKLVKPIGDTQQQELF